MKLKELKLETRHLLFVTNVREMLTAAMPLKQLTEEQSVELEVKHLVSRSRSKVDSEKTQRRKQKEWPR